MNPVIRKNRYLTLLILGTTLIVVLYFISRDLQYLAIPFSQLIYALGIKKKAIHYIVLISLYTLFVFFIISLLKLTVLNNIFQSFKDMAGFVLLFFLSLIVVPYKLIGKRYEKVLAIAEKQQKYYTIVAKSPNLVCEKHLTRTTATETFSYKSVDCRISEDCIGKQKITFAEKVIGLIGKHQKPGLNGNDYYASIWNHWTHEITDGDYDIIEVHENSEIQDYNAVISKVTSFLYNELNRYKPINQITIKISDNIMISESTKRLMQERYLKVEYL